MPEWKPVDGAPGGIRDGLVAEPAANAGCPPAAAPSISAAMGQVSGKTVFGRL